MDKLELKIGYKVELNNGKQLFVRELHNNKRAGLSYTMETPAEKSYGVLYEVIKRIISKN